MSFCLVLRCGNDSRRDEGTFCRVPKVITHQGEAERERSVYRRRLWIKAIARDDLTENLATHFNDRTISFDQPRQFPLARRTAAVIAAWLVPGAGHLVLGKNGRALLFFITIAGAFALGLLLSGHLYWPTPDRDSTFRFDLITVLWFFTQVGSGLCYIISYLLGLGTAPIPQAAASPTFEYGNTFMILAGLLNYLVVYDAFDIAAGRKR